jgi:hypothetical protein
MAKSCLVSSFHSSVMESLTEEEDCKPIQFILSFDSHLDVDFIGSLETVWNAIRGYSGYDKGLHFALTDPSIHMLVRKWFPDTEIKVVIPRVCVEGYINHNVHKAHESKIISLESVTAEDVSAFNSFWLKQLNISLVLSPPKDPASLSDLVSNDTVIDLDADYFADLQNECYIPRIGAAAKLYEFGNMERVLRLIRSTKPDTITFSESRISCLNDPNSKTSYLLNKLRNMGYEIEKRFLFSSDEEARLKLDVIKRFSVYLKDNSTFDADKRLDEIGEVAKKFFTKGQIT